MLFRFVRGCFQTLLLGMLLMIPVTLDALVSGGVDIGLGLLRLAVLVLATPVVARMAFRRRPRAGRVRRRTVQPRTGAPAPKAPRAA